MKYGQLVEYNEKIFFFKNHADNETGSLVSDQIFFLKKVLFEVKARGQHLSFNISW